MKAEDENDDLENFWEDKDKYLYLSPKFIRSFFTFLLILNGVFLAFFWINDSPSAPWYFHYPFLIGLFSAISFTPILLIWLFQLRRKVLQTKSVTICYLANLLIWALYIWRLFHTSV